MKKGYYFQFKASNELIVSDVTGLIEAYRWVGSFQPKDSTDYDPDEFVKLAARSLTNDLVRLHFPHLYVEGLELFKGVRAWSQKVWEMRSKVLSQAGKWGKELPLVQRSLLKEGQKIVRGSISLEYTGQSLRFNTLDMEVSTWLEFCADMLRDALTLQIDKRYYVPWLITRPMGDFIGRGLKTQVSQFEPVEEWVAIHRESDSPPENIPLPKKITDEVPQWSDQTMENSLGTGKLDFDQVIALGSMRADNRQVALIKVSDDSYTMVMVQEEDDGFNEDGTFTQFESYEEFLLLLVRAGQHLDFMQLGINPGLGKIWEKASFGAWLNMPGQNVPIKLKNSRDELRKELLTLGTANELPLRVGGVRLTSGLSWEALSPESLLIDGESVRKWIFLAHASPEAKSFNTYFPELSILVNEWRKLSKEEGLASEFPTSAPSVESVGRTSPGDLDELISRIEEAVIEVPVVGITVIEPAVEAVEFVAEVPDKVMTVTGSSLTDILANLQQQQDAEFSKILQNHSLS